MTYLVHITARPAPERTADDNALWHDEQENLDPIVKVMWLPSPASDVFGEAVSALPVIVAASIWDIDHVVLSFRRFTVGFLVHDVEDTEQSEPAVRIWE